MPKKSIRRCVCGTELKKIAGKVELCSNQAHAADVAKPPKKKGR